MLGIIFAEGTGKTQKYLKVENNKVSIVNDKPEDARATISNACEYYAEECNGRNSIFKVDGELIMKCDVLAYTELPTSTYLKYQSMFSKDLLFVDRKDKIELVNLNKVDTLRNFDLGIITVYDNSPFFYVLSDSGTAKVCNLFKGVDPSRQATRSKLLIILKPASRELFTQMQSMSAQKQTMTVRMVYFSRLLKAIKFV